MARGWELALCLHISSFLSFFTSESIQYDSMVFISGWEANHGLWVTRVCFISHANYGYSKAGRAEKEEEGVGTEHITDSKTGPMFLDF